MYKIAEYQVGSHLYGTQNENSDQDFCGVFIADLDHYFGLKQKDELNESITSKDENDKNTKYAVDKKFYEIRKFFKLAMDNNPAIIEHLFVPPDKFNFIHPEMVDIINNRYHFLHKGLYHRFLGYAYSQKRKMVVKLDKYSDYEYVRNILKSIPPNKVVYNLEQELKDYILINKNKEKLIEVGDIKIPMGVTCKKAIDILDKRFKSLSNRTELIKKHGFDTKFASHLIRLVMEGIELLKTGNLKFPLQYNYYIRQIKDGYYSLDDILCKFDELEKEINYWMENSILPTHPNREMVNKLLIDILVKHFYVNIKETGLCQNIL